MGWRGKAVAVTGAASGIGRATALAFARRGCDLALCDVDEAGLERTSAEVRALGRRAIARGADVGAPGDVEAFAAAVHREVGAVDVLVNNAGVGLGATFLDTTLADWEWIVRINVMGVVHGCHFFLPPMVERRSGHVVNIASMAAFAPLPAQGAYAATKYAVLGLTETLRAELAPSGIGATAVCPGFINTRIPESSRLRGIAAEPEIRRRTIDLYRRRNYAPERVAESIVRAVRRNRAVAPVSIEAWATHYAVRLAPGLVRAVTRLIATVGLRPEHAPARPGNGARVEASA